MQHYYIRILGPFEEMYRKSARQPQGMQGRPQAGFPMPGAGQGNPAAMNGIPGTFPPVGSLPAMNGHNDLGMMVQPINGGNIQVPDMSAGGVSVPFAGQPQLPTRQQPPNGLMSGLNGTNGISATGSMSELNVPGPGDVDADARKRKMEDSEELNGKRARQKTGETHRSLSLTVLLTICISHKARILP